MRRKIYSVDEATKKLEYYCSYQERCHQEVEKKLNEMNLIIAAKEAIIIHLLEHDFLNEERFAKAFAGGKFRIKKWGKQRIIRALKAKQISEYNIQSALKEINNIEYELVFNELSHKKLIELQEPNKYKKRKKLADYLLYRGWESDIVYKRITELIP